MLREANENYRKAALTLAREVRQGSGNSYLFSSAVRGEGTTTALLNVARHLKESGELSVLVVEMNQDKPSLARALRLDAEKTVQALASGRLPAAECVQTTDDGLTVIPAAARGGAGKASKPVSSVLHQILTAIGGTYDVILVDTPPLLTSADAMTAAAVVPRVMLVVEAGRTRFEMLERIQRELTAEGVRLVGLILNKHRRFIPQWVYRWLVQ